MDNEKWFIEAWNAASESRSNIGTFDTTDDAEAWIDEFEKENTRDSLFHSGFTFTIHCINSPELAMSDYGLVITDPAYDY